MSFPRQKQRLLCWARGQGKLAQRQGILDLLLLLRQGFILPVRNYLTSVLLQDRPKHRRLGRTLHVALSLCLHAPSILSTSEHSRRACKHDDLRTNHSTYKQTLKAAGVRFSTKCVCAKAQAHRPQPTLTVTFTLRYSPLILSFSASITDASSPSETFPAFLRSSNLSRQVLPSSKALERSTCRQRPARKTVGTGRRRPFPIHGWYTQTSRCSSEGRVRGRQPQEALLLRAFHKTPFALHTFD